MWLLAFTNALDALTEFYEKNVRFARNNEVTARQGSTVYAPTHPPPKETLNLLNVFATFISSLLF